MRKKYLSALLFGALLVTSTGTFTSCKDYDDDINGLQEQINTINTTLSELKDQISGGVSSVTFDEATGVLTVVDGSETKTYTIKTASEAMCEAVIKDGVLYLNEKEVGPVVGEVKVEGNKLIVDGEEIAEIGSKVVLVKNLDEGTCDLTVDNETVTLPLASANVSVTSSSASYFANLSSKGLPTSYGDDNGIGINWGDACNYEGEWKGSKTVAKGQLLVGKINPIEISILPATFDLTTAKLTLINTLGEEAPVIVTPVASAEEGPLADSGSRAGSQTGKWNLEIAMKETVTTENIGSIFASKDGKNNVSYALAINGTVVTDYQYYVDTDVNPTISAHNLIFSDLKFVKEGSETFIDGNYLPLGTTELFFNPSDYRTDNVYDSYIEIVDVDKAEAAGITAEGMKIIAPNTEAAADVSGLKVNVHVLYVDGHVYESEGYISFGNVQLEAEDLGTQESKLMPNATGVIIDLGETFTSLTAEEADKISKGWYDNSSWEFDETSKTIYEGSYYANVVKYYASIEDINAEEDKSIGLGVETTTIRTIRYAVIPTEHIKYGAKVGENKFTLTLRSTQDDELKKVTGIVNVTVPTFSEVMEKNADAKVWNGSELTVRLDADGKASLENIYKPVEDSGAKLELLGITALHKVYYTPYATYTAEDMELQVLGNAVEEGKLTKFTATVNYPIVSEKLQISEEITINPVSYLDGAKIVNLDKDGKQTSFVTYTAGDNIEFVAAGYDEKAKIFKSGAVILLADGKTMIPFKQTTTGDDLKLYLNENVVMSTRDAALTADGFTYDVPNYFKGEKVIDVTITEKASDIGIGVKQTLPITLVINTSNE